MNFVSKIITKKRVSFLAIAGSILYMSSQTLAPAMFVITGDPCNDKETNKSIHELVQRALLIKVSSNELLKKLNEYYPFIKLVEIKKCSNKKAYVVIKAYKPLIKITSSLAGYSEYYVCQDGALYEKKFFDNEYIEHLPAIVVAGPLNEEKIKDKELTQCAMELSYELFEKFTITWHSKSEILLQSRDTKSILIADIHTINEKARYESIERIRASDAEKYSNGIKADIRLSDSLVCSPL